MTTVLAIISGYTVYKSHRDAAEAKRSAAATLAEAQLVLDSCRQLKDLHNVAVNELDERKRSFVAEVEQVRLGVFASFEEVKNSFTKKMEAELEIFRHSLHEASTINRSKTQLMELLAEKEVTAEAVFPFLTDILDFPDQRSIAIYEVLLERFGRDDQICRKVIYGLRIFRERHFRADGPTVNDTAS